jgi:hypothetical protein
VSVESWSSGSFERWVRYVEAATQKSLSVSMSSSPNDRNTFLDTTISKLWVVVLQLALIPLSLSYPPRLLSKALYSNDKGKLLQPMNKKKKNDSGVG